MSSKLAEAIDRQRAIVLTPEERVAFIHMGDESVDTDTRVAAMRHLLDSSDQSRAFMKEFYEILFRWSCENQPNQGLQT